MQKCIPFVHIARKQFITHRKSFFGNRQGEQNLSLIEFMVFAVPT